MGLNIFDNNTTTSWKGIAILLVIFGHLGIIPRGGGSRGQYFFNA